MRLAENSEIAILRLLDARARKCSSSLEAFDIVACIDVCSLPACRPPGWASEVWEVVLAMRRAAHCEEGCVEASDG